MLGGLGFFRVFQVGWSLGFRAWGCVRVATLYPQRYSPKVRASACHSLSEAKAGGGCLPVGLETCYV